MIELGGGPGGSGSDRSNGSNGPNGVGATIAALGMRSPDGMRDDRSVRRRALICAPVPPEFDRESGSRRIYHMIEFLRSAGWFVAFVCENAPPDSRHLQHLRDRGVPAYVGFGDDTAHLVESGGFDVAVFAFWYLADQHAELVRRCSPETRIVVESVDLHWLRGARQTFQGLGDGGGSALDSDYGDEFVRELNAYASADRVLTVSDKEAHLVNDLVGRPNHAVSVPDSDELPAAPLDFDDRRGVVFVGNFRHPPNLDAATWLCEAILPLVPDEVRAEHPLLIVGNGLDGRVRERIGSHDHVRLVGWVPELEPYLHAARASAVPLRFGAGTKRKLFQSLMAGTPVVTTPVGIEGMGLADGEHLLVGPDAARFAAALTRILTEPDLWARLADRGRERVCAAHDQGEAARRFVEVMEDVRRTPPRPHREIAIDRESHARRFRRSLESAVPRGTDILVVSRGDPDLVRVPGLRCEHFPRDPGGGYAGYHPHDSDDAIRHFEESVGAEGCIAFPSTSFWWLEHYPDFARYLKTRLRKVWEDETCVVFHRAGDSGPRRGPAEVPLAEHRVGMGGSRSR